jgi:hypothetical protein
MPPGSRFPMSAGARIRRSRRSASSDLARHGRGPVRRGWKGIIAFKAIDVDGTHPPPGPRRRRHETLFAAILRERIEADVDEWIKPYFDALHAGDPELPLRVAEAVLDRAYGKPVQPIEHSGEVVVILRRPDKQA